MQSTVPHLRKQGVLNCCEMNSGLMTSCVCVYLLFSNRYPGFHFTSDQGSVDDTAKFYETGSISLEFFFLPHSLLLGRAL